VGLREEGEGQQEELVARLPRQEERRPGQRQHPRLLVGDG